MKQLILKINSYDHFGRGISEINGKKVFVNNALVGEIVEIKVLKQYKKYIEAEVIRVIEKNENRKNAECMYYGICGGCQIMHMSYVEQLRFKEDKIKNIFMRYFDVPVKINSIISGGEFGYRNKITLKKDKEKVGFYKNKSNTLVEIDKCLNAHSLINDKINGINLKKSKDDVVIRCGINTGEVSIFYDNGFIYEKLGDLIFKVSKDSFFQVNTLVAKKLYDLVLTYSKLTKDITVLDLYCGTGSIGLYLARYAKKVLGVEINESAIIDANYNKKINNINNIEFICSDASNLNYDNFDIVVVDPPRSGLNKKMIDELRRIASNRIIYVSCDPITLVRDLNILKEDYDILEITPVDMFPNTYHVECVVLLEKK